MSSSQGQAQPGQAQHGAGGCAGPTACGLVWGRGCLAGTGREPRERRALHQAASATATAKAAPGRRAPPRGRGAAIARLHDLRVADCLPLQRETVARQHQPLSPALGATIVVLVKVGAGLHDLNEVDVNMLRAIRGCLSGGRYRAGGRAWAEAAHRCHQRASERPAKSLRNWKRPRSEITPLSAPRTHGCWFLYELLFRAYSRLGFGSLNSTDTRRSPVLDGAVWASVLFSLLSKQSCCYVTLRFVTLRFVTLRYGPPRRRLRPSAMPPWRRHIRTELPGASWAARRRLLQLGDRGSV